MFVTATLSLVLIHAPAAQPTLDSPFCATVTTTIAATAAAQDVDTAKERESGHRYPVSTAALIRTADKDDEGATPTKMDLLGLAVREKTIFSVNVYSYALYVDQGYITDELDGWKGKTPKAAGKDGALFRKLLTPGPTKEIRLRFCRNVDAEDIASAFEDSIEPRLLARRKAMAGSKADKLKDLTEFRGFFSIDKLKKGNELRFIWHADGTLSTVVNGQRKPDVFSPDLCWALFDVYLGVKPISKAGKKKLVRRLPWLLDNQKK